MFGEARAGKMLPVSCGQIQVWLRPFRLELEDRRIGHYLDDVVSDLITTHTDVRTDGSGKILGIDRKFLAQSEDCCLRNAGRGSAPAGMNSRHCRSLHIRYEDRHTVGCLHGEHNTL